MTGHASGHRVNGVLYIDATLFKDLFKLMYHMLGLGYSKTVTRHDDYFFGIVHQDRCIADGNIFHRAFCFRYANHRSTFTKGTEDDVEQRSVHGTTHHDG